MHKERSAGAIIYRLRGRHVEFLLIKQHTKRSGYWSFPRGHLEAGENDEQAAIREVKEEVGLDITILPGFSQDVTYRPRADTIKTIMYFLAKCDGKVVLEDEEVMTYQWATMDQARKVITIKDILNCLEDANEFLLSK
jgi:bis(5'-nucleosidyl)-tetraphosphatase